MAFYRCVGEGTKTATGTATLSTSGSTTVNLGFKPKYLVTITYSSNNKAVFCVYDSSLSDSSIYRGAMNTSTNSAQRISLPVSESSSTSACISSITDIGFTMTKSSSTYGTNCYYFAIG